MKRQPKQGYLGPAFHEWLEWLEYVECILTTEKRPGKPKYMAMNDTLFKCEDDADFTRMMNEAVPVDAWLARAVRSSVKYKVTAETFAGVLHHYEDELRYIRKTTPIHLPHEWCTLLVEFMGDTYMICLQETVTKTGERYDEIDVEADEKWICANICFYRPGGVEMLDGKVQTGQKLSYCPVELHMQKGRLWEETKYCTAITKGVEITDKGKQAIDIARAFILIWLESFQLGSVLRSKTVPGTPPMPVSYIPTKRRKKTDHPKFEHTIIEFEVDQPECAQTGRSVFQPKKRLHQVRGFIRHMRSGKKVWVKPHWRGDEHLGVVKKDYEVTMHDNEGDSNVNVTKATRSEPARPTNQSGRNGDRSVFRNGSDSFWHRTRKALGNAWLSVVRTSR